MYPSDAIVFRPPATVRDQSMIFAMRAALSVGTAIASQLVATELEIAFRADSGSRRKDQMAFPYRRILAPIEFDNTAHAVLDAAVRIATETGGTVFPMHVVPMVVAPTGMPNYVDIYKDQEKIAQQKLAAIVECRRAEVKCELMTRIGDPASEILALERQMAADLIVLATHGRKGVRRIRGRRRHRAGSANRFGGCFSHAQFH